MTLLLLVVGEGLELHHRLFVLKAVGWGDAGGHHDSDSGLLVQCVALHIALKRNQIFICMKLNELYLNERGIQVRVRYLAG